MKNKIKGIPKCSGRNTNTSGHYESSYENVICSRGLVYHLQKEEFVVRPRTTSKRPTHSSMHGHCKNFISAFFLETWCLDDWTLASRSKAGKKKKKDTAIS